MNGRLLAGACIVLLLAGCVAPQPLRSPEVLARDIRIFQAVEARLDNDPTLYARHIRVSVYAGVVTLSGYVFDPYDLGQAIHLAAQVPGVTRVSDEMEVDILGRRGRR